MKKPNHRLQLSRHVFSPNPTSQSPHSPPSPLPPPQTRPAALHWPTPTSVLQQERQSVRRWGGELPVRKPGAQACMVQLRIARHRCFLLPTGAPDRKRRWWALRRGGVGVFGSDPGGRNDQRGLQPVLFRYRSNTWQSSISVLTRSIV